MEAQEKINIQFAPDQKINGLGLIIGQYLEQNLEEFEDKVKQARKLKLVTSVEMEKGMSTSLRFAGDKIKIQNGVANDAHLHLKSNYKILAAILSGKTSAFKAVMNGEIKMIKIPMTKPIQMLSLMSFLKIPEKLLTNDHQSKIMVLLFKKALIFISGMGLGFGITYVMTILEWI